jgi:hypothetical protein
MGAAEWVVGTINSDESAEKESWNGLRRVSRIGRIMNEPHSIRQLRGSGHVC